MKAPDHRTLPSGKGGTMCAPLNLRSRPPFAREVLAARRTGEAVNVHVHLGRTAWDRAKLWGPGSRVVVPLDLDHGPGDYDFRFLDGLAVTLNAVDADPIIARQVAVQIAEQGAALVVVLHPDLPKNSEFFYGCWND